MERVEALRQVVVLALEIIDLMIKSFKLRSPQFLQFLERRSALVLLEGVAALASGAHELEGVALLLPVDPQILQRIELEVLALSFFDTLSHRAASFFGARCKENTTNL